MPALKSWMRQSKSYNEMLLGEGQQRPLLHSLQVHPNYHWLVRTVLVWDESHHTDWYHELCSPGTGHAMTASQVP